MRLSKAIEGFLLEITAAGYNPNTISNYRFYLRLLTEQIGDIPIEAIKSEHLVAFMAWLQTKYTPRKRQHLAPASIDNAWKGIRSFFRWAHNTLGVPRPDLHLPRPRYEAPEIQPFTEEEIRALLKATEYTREARGKRRKGYVQRRPTALRDKAILLLLLDTGIRSGEFCRLRVQDVDLETGAVFIRAFRSGRKTKSRFVYLGRKARRALWRYLASRGNPLPEEPLFLTNEMRPFSQAVLRHLLRRLGERAGVPNVYPHRFRHTFAIQYLRNGGDVFTLQRLLGHSSLDMVRRYLHIVRSDLETAHRTASPVDRWRL